MDMTGIWQRLLPAISFGVCRDSYMFVTSLILMCATTHSYVWHELFKYERRASRTVACARWVMSHIWMSHVTHVNESRHRYEWVMSHRWISHVTRINESYHTYERAISHIWMIHGTHMNESWHICAWGMAHRSMSHVTHMNGSCHAKQAQQSITKKCDNCAYECVVLDESCHTYEWVMSHISMSHGTCVYDS